MYDGVFQVLRNSSSLELAVASFHLLMDLGKQYPRTYLTDSDGHQSLVVVKESWLPFLIGNGSLSSEMGGNARISGHLFDPSRFSLLIEAMVEPTNPTDDNNGIKAIKNMMLFQYLVNTLEADFVPRHIAYKKSLDWVIFRESLLNMLLVSRKLVFKSFVKDCMYLLLNQFHPEAKDAVEGSIPSEGEAKSASDMDSSLNYLLLESERTLVSLRKLFVMVMELDLIRKEADTLGLTSRADGFRNPIMEVILDELTYNISYLSPFLLAFMEWKWKLEIILQYFSEYCGKGAVRTRRSDNSQQDLKLGSVLSFFSTTTSAKAIVKKMGTEVAQHLLAHAYQVVASWSTALGSTHQSATDAASSRDAGERCREEDDSALSSKASFRRPPMTATFNLFSFFTYLQVCLSVQSDSSDSTATTEKIGASLQEISCNFISAFQNLRKVGPNIQISPFEKEAQFTAATLSRKLKNEER
ncbi:uncharacterized protein C2845_PM12G13140 [Panicum miliaceum]|uniref:Negative regulator of systemic acquired resistance SNI1 n=1 Tax=Panicum miliaceum TaxID=4540 RepID=A0A3L6QFY7_PANMI|nr:uncharacterized protein C2845_PM12G13140 [Panicum miliaceum]